MPLAPIIASAPGSLMLLGEHAVLHGRRALTAAINQRLRVTLTPRSDDTIEVASTLARHTTTLAERASHPHLRFVMEAIRRMGSALSHGFDLHVESEFSHTIGFGSSAAVTVATVAALRKYSAADFSLHAIREESIAVIRSVQGRGSGADAAASTHGGVVSYRAEPREVHRFDAPLRLCAVYSGYKTPTPEVIRHVEETWAHQRATLECIYDRMETCVAEGIVAVEQGDTTALGNTLNKGQALMEELGVNTPELARIIAMLRADPGMYGAKISGSGLGDCAIGLGTLRGKLTGHEAIPIEIAPAGLTLA